MAHPSYKATEILYTVIVRTPTARDQLTEWASKNRSAQIKIEEHRMHIFDHNTLSLFMISWDYEWNTVTIWDNWTKRHIHW
jgi:hypothetical protein